MSRIGFVGMLAVCLSVGLAGSAAAALPAPNFMPGFPMVAGGQAIFMWQPVIGAEKYRIYQNDKPVGEVTGFQHILTVPQEGEHVYYVVAVDKAGAEGAKGKPFTYAVAKIEKPKAITGIVRDNKISLRWDPVKDALIYDVFRGGSPDGEFQLIGSTQENLFNDAGAKPGVNLYYRISAKSVTGISSPQSDPFLIKIDVAAPVEEKKKKLVVQRSKVDWEGLGIPNIVESMYLPDGRIIASSPMGTGGASIHIIKRGGSPIKETERKVIRFPEEKVGKASFNGMGFSKDGRIWVTSAASTEIFLVDPDRGEMIDTLSIEPLPKTAVPYELTDVSEAPNGDLFVTEKTNCMILVVRGGKIVRTIGKKGNGPEDLQGPVFLEIAGDKLLVADGAASRIVVFSLEGKFIKTIGARGGSDPGTFMRLSGIAVDPKKGWIFAGDRGTDNIQIFDMEGKFIAALSNEDGRKGPGTNPNGLYVEGEKLLVSFQRGWRVLEYELIGQPSEAPK